MRLAPDVLACIVSSDNYVASCGMQWTRQPETQLDTATGSGDFSAAGEANAANNGPAEGLCLFQASRGRRP